MGHDQPKAEEEECDQESDDGTELGGGQHSAKNVLFLMVYAMELFSCHAKVKPPSHLLPQWPVLYTMSGFVSDAIVGIKRPPPKCHSSKCLT